MTFALKLTHDEPKLVYLALVYHLGRPGSELDPETKQLDPQGLRGVKTALGNELNADSAVIELDERQYRRLLSAIYGCVTELRGHHLRDGAPSTVERFSETARALFPEIAGDPAAALDVAEAMVMLHRRLERAVSAAMAPASDGGSDDPAKRRRWPFG
jgi:hypothetical protein